MFSLISSVVSTAVGGVSSYFKGKQEQKKIKLEHNSKIEVLKMEAEVEVAKGVASAKIEMAKNGQAQDFDLDKIAMQNMENSWKDELILIVFLIPMIMAFIPSLQDVAKVGFENIKSMPTWYTSLIIGMVVVIYGMRGLLKWVLQNKSKIVSKFKIGNKGQE